MKKLSELKANLIGAERGYADESQEALNARNDELASRLAFVSLGLSQAREELLLANSEGEYVAGLADRASKAQQLMELYKLEGDKREASRYAYILIGLEQAINDTY